MATYQLNKTIAHPKFVGWPSSILSPPPGGGGGGWGEVLPEKLGWGVRPASQNPYPIYDQNLQYSLPYLWPNFLNQNPVQTNVKLP